MRKYKLLCKKDYVEFYPYPSSTRMAPFPKTHLFKGVVYDIEEDEDGLKIKRAMILPTSFVGFYKIPFYDYFYTTDEMREMKLSEIGI